MKTAASATATVPAGQQAPATAPAAPAPAPKGEYARMGVSLSDLPVVGGQQPAAAPENPAAPAAPAVPADSQVDPAQTDPENPAPAATGPEAGELVAVTGRKFKDATELLTSYNESHKEVQRIVQSERTAVANAAAYGAQLEAANAALLELQGQVGAGVFPGIRQEDGKFMRELPADADEETRINFYMEKGAWNKRQAELKTSLENVKKNAEAFAAQTREIMAKTHAAMVADPKSYPEYEAVEGIRKDILEQSPYLDNRPETHYTTYLMAMGIKAVREQQAVAKIEADSKAEAAATAGAAALSTAGAGASPAGARKSAPTQVDPLESIVRSYSGRNTYK